MESNNAINNILTCNGMNLELLIVTEILKLNSLHYGFWNNGEELTLSNLRKAQERYTVTLLELIPTNVKTILDVGCGIGDIALTLAKKGYIVTAISPDKNHKKYFDRYKDNNISFYDIKFEDIRFDKTFDLILMSESQGNFSPLITFKQCNRYLKKPGYLLVSNIFNRNSKPSLNGVNSSEQEYITQAKEYNLKRIKSIDITKEILPTLQIAYDAHQKYFLPALSIMHRYIKQSSPLKYKISYLIFL
jgi:MPBQ/MSBQ methyltransferase